MWGRKAARIADLEARLTVALRNRGDSAEADSVAALRTELRQTRSQLTRAREQIAEQQGAITQLVKRLGEYADAGIANGQRADRYKAAWASARRRAKTRALPARGDAVEAWLRAQRDQFQDQYGRTPAWYTADHLLDTYRLHADTGTPLDQHVCEGRVVGDCECFEVAP